MPFKKLQIIYDWSYLQVHVHVALQIQQSFNHSLFMTPVFSPGFWEGHGVFWLRFLIVLVVSKKKSICFDKLLLFVPRILGWLSEFAIVSCDTA